VFGIIRRFSRRHDISLNRAALGFAGDRDLANPALSGSKRRQLDGELGRPIEKTVREIILPKIHAGMQRTTRDGSMSIAASDEANEER